MQWRQGGVRAGFQDLAEQPSVRDLDQLVGGKGTMALPLCRFAQDMYDAGLEAARVIEADAGIDGDLVRRSKADPADFGSQCVVGRSEEHTSELQSLMRISYAVFCLKKKTRQHRE